MLFVLWNSSCYIYEWDYWWATKKFELTQASLSCFPNKLLAITIINFFGVKDSRVAQLVNNLTAMQENWVQSLGWEDPLEKGEASHSRIPAWRFPWQSMGIQRVGRDWATFTSLHITCLTHFGTTKLNKGCCFKTAGLLRTLC